MLRLLSPLSPPLPRKGGGSRPCHWHAHALHIRRSPLSKFSLIIDDHAPRNAADRDRHRGLAAVDVDHRDVIAKAVRNKHGALVARYRDTPGALADQNVA